MSTVETRDLVFESVVDAAGTAKLMGDYSSYLILEALVEAHQNGTVGNLARLFEEFRPAMPHDNAAVKANVRERVLAAVEAGDDR